MVDVRCLPVVDGDGEVDTKLLVDESQEKLKGICLDAACNLDASKEKTNASRKCVPVDVGDNVYIKDSSRLTSLDPVYYGPFEVVRVMRPNLQIRDPRRGLRVVHLNNVRVKRQSQIVELPPANEGMIATEPVMGDEIPPVFVRRDVNVEANDNTRPVVTRDEADDELEIPIALRHERRNKPQVFGPEWIV